MTKNAMMQQNYPLAPIIEAVIDIRVLPTGNSDFSKLDQLVRKDFLKEFPQVAKQFHNTFQIQSGEYPEANPIASNVGLRFASEDNKQILQVKENGFTFSKLAPYENWEKFRERAIYLWKIYQKATSPQQINRLAVRFINRFDFPNENFELSDYLNIYPQIPQNNGMKGFSMQVMQDQPDINSILIITQALVPSNKLNTTSILLDFDLFNEDLRPIDDNFWLFLDELRLRKNHVFENAITNKTRKLISK